MIALLNAMLNKSRLKVVLDFSCAKTAALKPMQKMVTRNTRNILYTVGMLCISKSITAADPKELWAMMAIAA